MVTSLGAGRVQQRTALVTGGTDGIGKAIGLGLAAAGHRLLIVGRDAEKGQRTAEELREVSGNSDVYFIPADLSLMKNVVQLSEQVESLVPALHFLVHGAGIVRGRFSLTADGIESNFAVNYLARFVLSARLLPLLRAGGRPGAASRMLILGGAARSGSIDFDDPNLTARFGVVRAVGQFCQANDVLVLELARRLQEPEGPSTTVTCVKIGVVKTNIRREFPTWMKVMVPLLMDPWLAKTPAQVAAHALELLSGPAYEGVTAKHFLLIKRFKPIDVNAAARDPETGRRLWRLSETLAAEALLGLGPAQATGQLPVTSEQPIRS